MHQSSFTSLHSETTKIWISAQKLKHTSQSHLHYRWVYCVLLQHDMAIYRVSVGGRALYYYGPTFCFWFPPNTSGQLSDDATCLYFDPIKAKCFYPHHKHCKKQRASKTQRDTHPVCLLCRGKLFEFIIYGSEVRHTLISTHEHKHLPLTPHSWWRWIPLPNNGMCPGCEWTYIPIKSQANSYNL